MSGLIEFVDVSFAYSSRPVLTQISTRVQPSSCTAIIGPNGAGKTTFLRLMAGTLRPSSGDVLLEGVSLARIGRKQVARSIALVPQDMEVPFAFAVEEVVEQGRTPFLKPLGGFTRADRDAVERAMERTDTLGLRNRIFNELSGGERQRVKIALALAQEPTLLLLDEPAQQLDIGRQFEMIALLESLVKQGITVVASMHDLRLVEDTFSSVIAIGADGSFSEGSPRQMLRPEALEELFHCPPGSLRRRENCWA